MVSPRRSFFRLSRLAARTVTKFPIGPFSVTDRVGRSRPSTVATTLMARNTPPAGEASFGAADLVSCAGALSASVAPRTAPSNRDELFFRFMIRVLVIFIEQFVVFRLVSVYAT